MLYIYRQTTLGKVGAGVAEIRGLDPLDQEISLHERDKEDVQNRISSYLAEHIMFRVLLLLLLLLRHCLCHPTPTMIYFQKRKFMNKIQ